jgi:hypothetical protein
MAARRSTSWQGQRLGSCPRLYFRHCQLADDQQAARSLGSACRASRFSTWAGPVSVGTGLDFRKEELEATVDALSQTGGWSARTPAAQPHASYNVKEAYVETIVPLAKNACRWPSRSTSTARCAAPITRPRVP